MSAEAVPASPAGLRAVRGRASDLAYTQLRAEIIDWTLEPGTALGELETAARIGVSRTPLREALARLTAEGLVVSGGRTSRVAPLSRHDVEGLFELREALETQAARLAARRRDPEPFERLRDAFAAREPRTADGSDRMYDLAADLDREIAQASRSPHLAAALGDLRGPLERIRRIARQDGERLDQANREHLLIVEAILARDEVLAAQATAVHLRRSLDNIVAHVSE